MCTFRPSLESEGKAVTLILSHLHKDEAFCHQKVAAYHHRGTLRTVLCGPDVIIFDSTSVKNNFKNYCNTEVIALYCSEIRVPVSLESTVIE